MLNTVASATARMLWVAPIVLTLAATGAAADIVGRASVVDADTIEIAGKRIRLEGVDAPEAAQVCLDENRKPYRCGQQAALTLAKWLNERQPIRCVERGRDRYRRIVATCYRGDRDVAEWLAREGYALDWPSYSRGAYVAAQAEAEKNGRGIWRGSFDKPWEWRKR